ncbi:hypothetical protein [Halorubrum tibetense]|uniref:Uncharacterized protein n=1 Tax=Halorubrum tibetense TaxID=175631 RepID=A0ABD5S912_9EURY
MKNNIVLSYMVVSSIVAIVPFLNIVLPAGMDLSIPPELFINLLIFIVIPICAYYLDDRCSVGEDWRYSISVYIGALLTVLAFYHSEVVFGVTLIAFSVWVFESAVISKSLFRLFVGEMGAIAAGVVIVVSLVG